MNIYKTIDRARNAGVHVNTVRLYEKCCLFRNQREKCEISEKLSSAKGVSYAD